MDMGDQTEEQTLPEVLAVPGEDEPGALSTQMPQFGLLSPQAAQYQPQAQPAQQAWQNPLAGQGNLLLAMAGGIDKHGPMGGAMRAASEHFILQDKLKEAKDKQALALKLQQDKLDETKRLNDAKVAEFAARTAKEGAPKVVPLQGGAFSQVTWPSGATTVIPNDKVQEYAGGILDKKLDNTLIAAGAKIDAAPDSVAQQKLQAETRERVFNVQNQLGKYTELQDMLKKTGAPELAGMPFLKQMGQLFGTDDAETMRRLSEIKVDEGFTNAAKGQGAITDYERNLLLAPVPKDWASTKTWQDFMEVRVNALMKLKAFADHEAALAQPEKKGLATMQGIVADRQAARSQAYPGKAGQMVQSDGTAEAAAANSQLEPLKAAYNSSPADSAARKAASDKIVAMLNAAEKGKGNLIATNGAALPDSPAAAVAPAAGPLKVSSPAEAQAAIKSGKLKSGDSFIDENGKIRKVK